MAPLSRIEMRHLPPVGGNGPARRAHWAPVPAGLAVLAAIIIVVSLVSLIALAVMDMSWQVLLSSSGQHGKVHVALTMTPTHTPRPSPTVAAEIGSPTVTPTPRPTVMPLTDAQTALQSVTSDLSTQLQTLQSKAADAANLGSAPAARAAMDNYMATLRAVLQPRLAKIALVRNSDPADYAAAADAASTAITSLLEFGSGVATDWADGPATDAQYHAGALAVSQNIDAATQAISAMQGPALTPTGP